MKSLWRRMFLRAIQSSILSLLLAGVPAPAQNLSISPEDGYFRRGSFEASVGSGGLFSPVAAIRNRPTLNYTYSEFQVGCMLSDVAGRGLWRGNWQVSSSAFGGAVFDGVGSYVAGATLWLRYNFVPQRSRFVPFAQAGAGLTATEINSRLVGQDFNFNLDLGAGVRYLISSRWSINLEYRYQHISNANLADRNLGVNAHGPLLAVSFLF